MTRTHATRARGVEAALVAAIALLATAAAWLRLPPIAQRTIWAEDGNTFLNDAISGAPLEHLFAGYAGYLQFVPRLLADGTVAVADFRDLAVGINFASCAVAGLCAALVYWCSRDVVPAQALRLILAAITIGAPLLPIEVLGNAANVHWVFIWTVLWILLYLPRTRVGSILLSVTTLVFALSDIQLLFLAPLFLIRRGSFLVWPPRIALAVGLVAQFVVSVTSPRVSHPGGLGGAIRAFVGQTALATFVPDASVLNGALGSFSFLWTALAIAPFVLAAGYTLRRGTGLQRIAALYLVPGAFALWTADSFLNGYGGAALTARSFEFVRYAVVPSMFLLASVVVAAQVALSRPVRVARWTGAIISIAVLALLAVHFIPHQTNRSTGPEWAPAIVKAQQNCNTLPPTSVQPITTAPDIGNSGWTFGITCARLDE